MNRLAVLGFLSFLPFNLILAEVREPISQEWEAVFQRIIIAPTANADVREAARTLADRITERFGIQPKLQRAPLWQAVSTPAIRIGHSLKPAVFDANPLLDQVKGILTPNSLILTGQDNSATRMAINRFQQEILGVRQYIPGPHGLEWLDELPALPSWQPGAFILDEEAAFYSRNASGIGGTDPGGRWQRFQGLRERFSYNHAHFRQIRPEHFDTHPEWFAKDAGGRAQRPPFAVVNGYNDHPDFTHPATLQRLESVGWNALVDQTPLPEAERQRVAPLLDSDPNRSPAPTRISPGLVSLSLSANDSYEFTALPVDHPEAPDGFFRNWPDYSNHIFSASNQLAERLTHHWQAAHAAKANPPELFFGTLAYLWWEDLPDFPVHPQIVPYMTFDRSQWADAAAKADDLLNLENWSHAPTRVNATWDYLFGFGFHLPRSLTSIVSESIPALYERRVRAYFCQISPIWAFDGHTTWLIFRLLWNPHADAEALLDEYFAEFYGPAAEPMRSFFDHAESIWMDQDGHGWWLRWWKDPDQFTLYSADDLEIMDTHLKEALQATDGAGDRFAARVQLAVDAFSLTRAFWHFRTEATLLALMNPSLIPFEDYLAGAARTLHFRNEFNYHFDLLDKAGFLFGNIYDREWVDRNDNSPEILAHALRNYADTVSVTELRALYSKLLALQEARDSRIRTGERTIQRSVSPAFRELLQPLREHLSDPDLSEWNNPEVWAWQFLSSAGLGRFKDSPLTPLRVVSPRRVLLTSTFTAEPGEPYWAALHGAADFHISTTAYIRIDFFNDEREFISSSAFGRIPPKQMSKGMVPVQANAFAVAPEDAAFGRVAIRFFEANPGDQILITDVSVLGPAGEI